MGQGESTWSMRKFYLRSVLCVWIFSFHDWILKDWRQEEVNTKFPFLKIFQNQCKEQMLMGLNFVADFEDQEDNKILSCGICGSKGSGIMMGDPGIASGSIRINYLWNLLIVVLYLIYGRILQDQIQNEVNQKSPLWCGTYMLFKECRYCYAGFVFNNQTKGHIRRIYCGIWSLIQCRRLLLILMVMKGRIMDGDTLYNTDWGNIVFKGSMEEAFSHRFQLMQPNYIILLIFVSV
jgi:hypothetical protein